LHGRIVVFRMMIVRRVERNRDGEGITTALLLVSRDGDLLCDFSF